MGRSGFEVVVALFNVFSVVAFVVHEAEQPLFEDGILLVPETQREAEATLSIANTQQSVFPPAVGARTRLFMRKITPTEKGEIMKSERKLV